MLCKHPPWNLGASQSHLMYLSLCLQEALDETGWETQCQWILMDINGNKPNTGVRGGNVLEEAWDVYVDPLVGIQRVSLCCTELLSPFCPIRDKRRNCFCCKNTQLILPLSAIPNLKQFCFFQKKQREKTQQKKSKLKSEK